MPASMMPKKLIESPSASLKILTPSPAWESPEAPARPSTAHSTADLVFNEQRLWLVSLSCLRMLLFPTIVVPHDFRSLDSAGALPNRRDPQRSAEIRGSAPFLSCRYLPASPTRDEPIS